MITKRVVAIAIALGGVMVSCSKDDDPAPEAPAPETADFKMTVRGLQDLGTKYEYEGWLIVDDKPVSTGKFASTEASQEFTVLKSDLDAATEFILSIEPTQGDLPEPSETKLLQGKFDGNLADLTVFEVVGDFSSSDNVSGQFLLAAPTSDVSGLDYAGIWFETTDQVAGLKLPVLSSGWEYEGWVVFQEPNDSLTPLSTGKFTDPAEKDSAADFSGPNPGPDFPGEDFLVKAKYLEALGSDLLFPLDVRGKSVVISIEPSNDMELLTPFFLKPLAAIAGDEILTNNMMQFDKANFPRGEVIR